MKVRWISLLSLAFLVALVSSPASAQWWWRLIIDLTDGVGQYTSLELDSLSFPHISYYDQSRRDLRYAYWDGANMNIDTVEAAGNVGNYTSLALDSLGRPCISYFSGLVSGELRYATKVGAAWSMEVVDAANVREQNTSLVLEPGTDYRHISYCGDNHLKYARWDGSWHTETVDPNQWTGIESSIALDPTNNNYPCISYVDGWNSTLAYAWWDGGNWHFETVDNNPGHTSLAIDATGVAHIGYSQITPSPPFPRSLKYARRIGPNNWSVEPINYSSTNYGSFPSIGLDMFNNPRISFCDDVAADLLLASRDGAWDIDTVDYLDRVGQYSSLAMKNGVLPCISYYDETNEHPKYAEKMFLDVGVELILAPPDTVEIQTQQVQARIKNFGNLEVASSFSVNCTIDGGYDYWAVVPGPFLPDSTYDVNFPAWDPGAGGTYTMCVITQFPDDNPANDQLCKPIVVAVHDAGVDSIVSPPDSVAPNSSHPVEAGVRNLGNVPEIFDVHCWIPPTPYNEMVSCTLNPGGAIVASFPVWLAPGTPQVCTMWVATLLSNDGNEANDTLWKNIWVLIFHDGAVDSIFSPPDTVTVGNPYPVEALVHNYGTMFEDSFEVKCELDGWRDSTWVYGLGPDIATTVLFPRNWTPSASGSWPICVWTLVPLEMVPSNDTLCRDTWVGVEELVDYQLPIINSQLGQNQPNPFSVSTIIRYQVAGNRQLVNLSVYDLGGRLVKSLVDEPQGPGCYSVVWSGRDGEGAEVPQGVYFYRLSAGDLTATRKLVLLR